MAKIRHKKRLVATILIFLFLLLLGAVMIFLHIGKNSPAVKEYEQQIAQQAETMTNDLLDQVSVGTQAVIADIEKNEGDNLASKEQDNNQSSQGAVSQGQKLSGSEKKALLEQRLKEQYHTILMNQKAEAIGMVESLLVQAKSDYQELVNSGNKNPTSLGNLMTQYMGKVDVMESQMDNSFNTLISKMGAELEAQGIDSSSIISEFKTEYKKIKEDNRNYFMDLAWSQIK